MIFLCDFETTGLLKPGDWLLQPGIVQVGALRLYSRCEEEKYAEYLEEKDAIDTFINPEVPFEWEKKAIETHGITPEMVKDAPTLFAFFDRFAEMATGCDTWAGYNSQFDKKVLKHQLERYGLEMNFPWPRQEIDVMELAKNHMAMQGKRGTKPPKLEEIYSALFNETFKAHDALADIRATARVMKELMK